VTGLWINNNSNRSVLKMAELAVGIIGLAGAAELCLRGLKALSKAAQDYNEADDRLDELLLRVEACWSRASSQLEVSKVHEAHMNEEQMNIHQKILRLLDSKFKNTITIQSKMDRYMKSGKRRKARFITLRDELGEAVSELEASQKRFKPSWLDLIKAAPPTINGTLMTTALSGTAEAREPMNEALKFRRAFDPIEPNKAIFASEELLDKYEKTALPHSMVEIAADPTQTEKKYHVIDTVSAGAVTPKAAIELASRLRESNPHTFGTLRCKAIVRSKDKSSMGFLFRVPDGIDTIRSMRGLLIDGQVPESLTIRLEMARQLANAVYSIHLYEFVHKNICPEIILSLGSTKSGTSDPLFCLVGFQVLRYADGRTNTAKLGNRYGIYQHPQRHGSDRPTFVMQHDIYSLGVCLLEIGLWESLLSSDGRMDPSQVLKLETATASPERVKDEMVALSRCRLRVQMGDKYSKVVETCLTCLDSDNILFGDPGEFTDSNGIEVGARYIEKVLDILNTISL
jgi:hypothetical protein